MSCWIDDARYDAWKTSPPEDETESAFKCTGCGELFYPRDRYYELEGECFCHECAKEWLEEQAQFASEDQCYGK